MQMWRRRRNPRGGYTLVEILTTLGIVSVLLAILIPAVQVARETARRTHCASGLRQLGLAVHHYHDVYGRIPAGSNRGFSLFVPILPFLDQGVLYSSLTFDHVENPGNTSAARTQLPLLRCPSDGVRSINPLGMTNYLGNYGTGLRNGGQAKGVFQHLSASVDIGGGPLSFRDISDGLSNTAAFSETLVASGAAAIGRTVWDVTPGYSSPNDADAFLRACELLPDTRNVCDNWNLGVGWMRGDHGATLYNHFHTPNRPSCTNHSDVFGGAWTASSMHRNGVEVCLADASVRFVSNSVDSGVWSSLATRSSADGVGNF